MSQFAEQELISKKELLARYGISYGALYRWKRKGLIPEEWFLKKSTVTGQETFFPSQPVCERIELILAQKDDLLLDDLAQQLNAQKERNTALVLNTIFGEKTILAKELKGIRLTVGDRQIDITEQFMQLISGFDAEQS